MNDDFELPVTYRGEEILFTSRLLQTGYSYKIEVDLPQGSVQFEKDDSGEWRGLSKPDGEADVHTDIALLQAITTSLDAVFE